MANFNISYSKTMGNEGFYADDPDDVGGETWKGIARYYHPTWDGWKIVDYEKAQPNFPAGLKTNIVLEEKVKSFYKANFWDVWLGDGYASQALADEMFDTGVNMGVSRAVNFLQEGLNLLNRNQIMYKDLVVDGKFGNNTFNTLDTFMKTNQTDFLIKIINVLQGMHYIEYMRKSPNQEKFARSWFSRVEFNKS
jgi:lysozyme family protein